MGGVGCEVCEWRARGDGERVRNASGERVRQEDLLLASGVVSGLPFPLQVHLQVPSLRDGAPLSFSFFCVSFRAHLSPELLVLGTFWGRRGGNLRPRRSSRSARL